MRTPAQIQEIAYGHFHNGKASTIVVTRDEAESLRSLVGWAQWPDHVHLYGCPIVVDYPARPYAEIHAERHRAHQKHHRKPGGSMEEHDGVHPRWLPVLTEELGEVARVLNDTAHGIYAWPSAVPLLRTELVQLAAMASAWIDALDHRPGHHPTDAPQP